MIQISREGGIFVSLSAMWCCRKFTSADVLPVTAILKGKPCETRTVTYRIALLCFIIVVIIMLPARRLQPARIPRLSSFRNL